MDNEKITNEPEDSSWLDELFGAVAQSAELGIDEAAMDSHDMGQISDRELDQIIQETKSDDWNIEDFEPIFDDPDPIAQYADNGEEPEEEPDEEDDEPFDPDAPVIAKDIAYWFTGCTNLVYAEVPGYWLTIGQRAFADCINLQEIVFASHGIVDIAEDAFTAEAAADLIIMVYGEEPSNQVLAANWHGRTICCSFPTRSMTVW